MALHVSVETFCFVFLYTDTFFVVEKHIYVVK